MSKRKLNEVESDRNNNEESAVNSAKVLKSKSLIYLQALSNRLFRLRHFLDDLILCRQQ